MHILGIWFTIRSIIRSRDDTFRTLQDTEHRTFIKKLIKFFKPTSNQFSRIDLATCARMARDATLAGCDLINFLLESQEPDATRFLHELLIDIAEQIMAIRIAETAHDALLSPRLVTTTCCQKYFLFLGQLSHSPHGTLVLRNFNFLDKLLDLAIATKHDCYVKLVISSLDYSREGPNRRVFSKIIQDATLESTRMYATQFLRILFRTRVNDVRFWAFGLLLQRLNDESRMVALTALEALHEACEEPEFVEVMMRKSEHAMTKQRKVSTTQEEGDDTRPRYRGISLPIKLSVIFPEATPTDVMLEKINRVRPSQELRAAQSASTSDSSILQDELFRTPTRTLRDDAKQNDSGSDYVSTNPMILEEFAKANDGDNEGAVVPEASTNNSNFESNNRLAVPNSRQQNNSISDIDEESCSEYEQPSDHSRLCLVCFRERSASGDICTVEHDFRRTIDKNRRDVLKHAQRLSNPVYYRQSRQYLLRLRQQYPEVFQQFFEKAHGQSNRSTTGQQQNNSHISDELLKSKNNNDPERLELLVRVVDKNEVDSKTSDNFDFVRCRNMTAVGLLQGPFHHYFYAFLEKTLPGKSTVSIFKKTLVDQTIASPTCLGIFFFGLGLMEQKNLNDINGEVKLKLLDTWKVDCMFWPPTQFINFLFVPIQYRVIYINLMTMIYDIFLSYMKYVSTILF
ncbi:unnamed protein product [Trichogramma brassicae]|uniref:Rapamycin-insensitive companion of mTOR middle domain-containing protein n=1 Tax=Trichogramma brassicae TaxID=86971 RepID=A0A6H5IEF8_9HYME|nr:unnamed protein product [Trichogramma brassicae]